MAGFVEVIWGSSEADYFCVRDWTGQISLKSLRKIARPTARRMVELLRNPSALSPKIGGDVTEYDGEFGEWNYVEGRWVSQELNPSYGPAGLRPSVASTLKFSTTNPSSFSYCILFACATIDRLFSLQSRGVGCSFSIIAKR